MDDRLQTIVQGCMRRAHHWPVPLNWSVAGWWDELRSAALAAASIALNAYDPGRGVPLDGFLHVRVMANTLTRYRQEYRFASRVIAVEQYDDKELPDASATSNPAAELVASAVSVLSDRDRLLVKELYWEGRTEAEIAESQHVTQQAVSKRKRLVLQCLKRQLEMMQATQNLPAAKL